MTKCFDFTASFKVSWQVDLNRKWKKRFAVQIEKTGVNILQKNGKKVFLLSEIEEKNCF